MHRVLSHHVGRYTIARVPSQTLHRRSLVTTILSPSDESISQKKSQHLLDVLQASSSPSRVWGTYTNFLDHVPPDSVPLHFHQEVLRKCTPPTETLRLSFTDRLKGGQVSRRPHFHETRFQAVLENILASGHVPTLDDYHFILEQFAALGHDAGAIRVFQDLVRRGHIPGSKTYGLCFQAIAQHLSFPIHDKAVKGRATSCHKRLAVLLDDMRMRGKQFKSVNLDLVLRILRDTTDMKTFDMLVRWAYAIDLSNPDCLPLEYQGMSTFSSTVSLGPLHLPPIPRPLDFSTPALNNILDMLGKQGLISKMVQTFEVLTNPLPGAEQHKVSSFDDDTDDDYGGSFPKSSLPSPPYTSPNTATFNILLRHLGNAHHHILSRHYLVQAINMERASDFALRKSIVKDIEIQDIPGPHVSVNRGMLLSVFGLGNRRKDLGLIKWLYDRIPFLLRKKRWDLVFYQAVRRGKIRSKKWPYHGGQPLDPELKEEERQIKSRRYRERTRRLALAVGELKEPESRGPEESSPPHVHDSASQILDAKVLSRTARVADYWSSIDTDTLIPPSLSKAAKLTATSSQNQSTGQAESDSSTEAPLPEVSPIKPFNLELHIAILKRNILEITQLERHIHDVRGRTAQRMKERLGRRVWAGKDIYLLAEHQRRTMTKDEWAQMARFRPLIKHKERHSGGP